MSKKKYLVEDHADLQYYLDTNDAKEVEVLDIDEVYNDFIESEEYRLLDYLKANNLLIVKIIE